ncbi:glycosyltransferase family 4 protein [Acetobacter sacchari]|uniref:glycosyltransferase family 4 protein n=1 Tax=Acetobacter sacchari TaxID=2661687 RepID=UPI001FAEA691|nr:glycosyltransferase family 1 protein [Acetobacter sacchari]
MSSSRLHVAIDGFNLALPRGTGVATYARTLSHALREMSCHVDVLYGLNIPAHAKAVLREVLFFDRLGEEEKRQNGRFLTARWKAQQRAVLFGQRAVEIPIDGHVDIRSFRDRLPAFNRILNARDLFVTATRHYRRTRRFMAVEIPNAPDIMHWTYPLPIRVLGAKNVYTIHDLVPLRLPHTTLDDKGFHFRLINDIVRHADAICTVSEASRRDILAFAPASDEILHNTYQAVRRPDAGIDVSGETLQRVLQQLYGLSPDGYFLYYGSIEPKKNIGRLIEAVLSAQTTRPLVIVGAMAWKSEGELRLLKSGVKAGRIIQLEYLPEADLMLLVRGARAVVFPSLSEGFGLPVVEAMAMSTPVLTSREASLPEVTGDAACLVEAYDVADIALGIRRLDDDDALCRTLREAGPRQAAKFDMETYQQRLKSFYAQVVSSDSSRGWRRKSGFK